MRKLTTESNPSLILSLTCLVTDYLYFRDRFHPSVFKIFLIMLVIIIKVPIIITSIIVKKRSMTSSFGTHEIENKGLPLVIEN
jgi:hypothetical protein